MSRCRSLIGFATFTLMLPALPIRAEETSATPPLTLAAAVAKALERDPALAALVSERRAQDARARQDGRPHNPVLATEVENFGRFGGDEGDAEATQTTVSLSQLLELGGKRGKRAAVARLDGRLVDWDYERARLDATARTFKAFVGALVAEEQLALAKRRASLARDLVTAVRRQIEAGGASAVELSRAEAADATAEAAALRRARELRAARAVLAASWGEAELGSVRLVGSLRPLPRPRPLAEFMAEVEHAPELARFGTTLERAEASVALEEARRVPDVTLRVGARRFVSAETNGFVAELSVPLPLFDRNADAVAEARERVGKVRAERQAAARDAGVAVGTGYEAMAAAYEQAEALLDRVIPRTRAALDRTRHGYDEGRLRFVEVLEAQRTLAELEGEHLEALGRFHMAAAELERVTGAPATIAEGAGR